MKQSKVVLSLATCFIVAALSQSASAMTLDDLSVGNTVHGPSLSLRDMKGKVVFVEYWGTRCPPCRALMPELAKLYKKYESQGFHLIGLECQGSSDGDIKKLAAQKGVTYQITTGGDLKGSNVRGIPHGFLFGPDGKLEANNPHGQELEDKIKELLKGTWGAMAGPGPYKKLSYLAKKVKTGKGLGSVLKTLRAKVNSKDSEEAEEAKTMLKHLETAANEKFDSAMKKKDSDPASALGAFQDISQIFSGDEIGTKAKTEYTKLNKDPKIRKERDAEAMWKRIEVFQGKLKPYRGSTDPGNEGFKKYNLQTIRQLVGGCKGLIGRYPGTKAAEKAQNLVDQYK